jgi:signal transduction histidine kinase
MAGTPVAVGELVDDIIERRARDGEYGPGDPAELARAQRRHDKTKPQVRRRQRPNGATIEVRTAPLPDGGHIGVVFDVTGIVTAEAELARRAEALDNMLAHIRHGIVLWDRDRRIVAANSVATGLLQAPPGLLVPGRTLAEVTQSALDRGNLGDGATGPVRAKWLLEQDRASPHIDQRLTRGGRVLEVRSDPTPQGGFVTTYTDVTHVREAEQALLLSKSAAEAANAAKSRFLASMSIELRTPLTTILDETDALARGAARGLDATRVADSTAVIAGSARTLLGLIDAVLDLTRLEAGRFDLAEDRVDVPHLVRSVLRRFDAPAAAAEVALVADIPEHLPTLCVDQRRLSQTLGSVVANAVKFTGAAGSVTITARRDWTQGGLLLQVSDTGPGIPEADLVRVFEPFVQLSQGGKSGTSAGLGLYVGRILMRAHGGDLTLRSIVGQGTTATLHVPGDRMLQDDLLDPN